MLFAACATPASDEPSSLTPQIDRATTTCDPLDEVWRSEVRVVDAYMDVLAPLVELATPTTSELHDLQLVSWDEDAGEQQYAVTIGIQATPVSDSGATLLSCNDDVSVFYHSDL